MDGQTVTAGLQAPTVRGSDSVPTKIQARSGIIHLSVNL